MTASQSRALQNWLRDGAGENLSLANGNNTITPPASADAVLIVPADTATQALVVKGVNGDTGVGLTLGVPCLMPINPAVSATFVLNSTGAQAVTLTYFRFNR